MANFVGQLTSNEIFSGIYNMIISQTVFGDGLDVDDFVAKFRVDGAMYGDTKLYYSADVLKSEDWTQDSTTDLNLLQSHRPAAPDVQAIKMNIFRQIALTLDDYMTKRAWADEGAFAQFNTVLLGMLQGTKSVIDYTTLATFIGTDKSTVGKQNQTVTLSGTNDAQTIAEAVADILVAIKRPSREYNDFANMRAVAPSKLMFIWNSKYVNYITKYNLPTIFHSDGLVDSLAENVLPPEYFGAVNTASGTTASTNTTVRALVEKDYGSVHCFPGDLLPNSTAYTANTTYTVDDKVICKIMAKDSVPYMSAFEVGTSFFNPRNLSTNHYLTWGRNSLEHLKDKPFVTLSKA